MSKIHKNLSEQEYNDISALRSTLLNIIDTKTMAQVKCAMSEQREATDSMILGSAFHDLILRPALFNQKWGILSKDYDGRTKVGKEEKQKLTEKFGSEILTDDQLAKLVSMSDGLKRNKMAKKLVESCLETELSLEWEEDSVACKARIDGVAKIKDRTILIDLKTSISASERDFQKSLINYGYILQTSHYLAGAKACGLTDPFNNDFIHIVIEKEAPYLTACYCLDNGSLEVGDTRRASAMQKYKEALKTNVWSGYPDTIQTIACPHWYFEQQEVI